EGDSAIEGRADVLTLAAVLGKRLDVVGVKEAIALRAGDGEKVGDGEREAADAEDVGAEVGDLLLDVEVRALDERHDGDEGGDAHRQAEDGERGAELVRADGIHGKREIVAQTHHDGEISVSHGRSRCVLSVFKELARVVRGGISESQTFEIYFQFSFRYLTL